LPPTIWRFRVLGLHLGGVDALGEREAPLECAVRELSWEEIYKYSILI
jgi:hypothetical protein